MKFNPYISSISTLFTKAITTLEMSGKELHDQGAQTLAKALKNNTVTPNSTINSLFNIYIFHLDIRHTKSSI